MSASSVIQGLFFNRIRSYEVQSDAILLPISLDGSSSEDISFSLKTMYPNISEKIIRTTLSGRLGVGSILVHDSTKPLILIAPFKAKRTDPYSSEYVDAFITKLESISDKIGIKSLSVEFSSLAPTDEICNHFKSNKIKLNLFFNKLGEKNNV